MCADRVDSINRDLIRSLESHIRGVTNSGTVVLVQALEQLMPSLQGLCADLAAYGEWLVNVDRIRRKSNARCRRPSPRSPPSWEVRQDMANRAFVFHLEDAQAVESALRKAADDLRREVEDARKDISGLVSGWSLGWASRQAQIESDGMIDDQAGELASALRKAEAAMKRIARLAHEAEVKNVAILD